MGGVATTTYAAWIADLVVQHLFSLTRGLRYPFACPTITNYQQKMAAQGILRLLSSEPARRTRLENQELDYEYTPNVRWKEGQ